jgi:competence protein ComEC
MPFAPAAVLLGWVAGTALQLQQSRLDAGLVYSAWLTAAFIFIGLCVGKRHQGARWLCALLAGLALGFGATGLRAVAFASHALPTELEGRDLVVVGEVRALPQPSVDALRFQLQVESASLDGQSVQLPPRIQLGWYSGFFMAPRPMPAMTATAGTPGALATPEAQADWAETLVQLQRQPQPMRAGERWQMTVRLKAPHGNMNPHGFDYELALWEQGVQATGSVRAGVRDSPPRRLTDSGWKRPLEQARQSVREAIDQRIPDARLAGILAALVMGDQNAIERPDWDVFRATGIAHLMSISGLHITLFAWLAGRLLSALWHRSPRWSPRWCLAVPASSAAAWGGLLLATAYALFSGWGLPAQRTVLMLAVLVLLRQSGRQWAWPQIWLLAMAVVVAADPWALLQAGFWLSFVAVGVLFGSGTGMAAPERSEPPSALPVRPGWGRAWSAALNVTRRFGQMLREQWVITLALTPLSLLLFNQVSLVGLVANVFSIPLVTLLITPLALLGVAWAPLWDAAAWLTGWLLALLQVLAVWPLATVSQAAVPLWSAAAAVAGGLLLVMRLPWHWRVLGLPLMLPVFLWQPLRPAPGAFELLAADVGQGNAVLVRTAKHSLLYDAGPRFSRESDAGHRVLVPLLRAWGERIDVLMLSHRDADHVGGAAAVLAMQPQARLVSSLEPGHELHARVKAQQSERCVAGQRWQWDGVDFELLHPLEADYPPDGDGSASASAALPAAAPRPVKPNVLSCVLKISVPGDGRRPPAAALLAGDIELAQEKALLSRGAALRADVLLVPHHGSKTSSGADFLGAVQPQLALAQAGYRNRFGHPAQAVLARYAEQGIPVLTSPDCGAASWHSAAPAAWTCARQAGRRYWHRMGAEVDAP